MSAHRLGLLLWLLLLPVVLISLWVGPVSLSSDALLQPGSRDWLILFELRLPRLVMSLAAGAILAITGASIQALFRNSLADPGLIGISAGAALAAVAVLVFGGAWLLGPFGPVLVPLAAFAGGLLVTALVLRIARTPRGVSVTTMLLAGIALNSIAAAAIGVMKYFSDELSLRQVTFWLLGNLHSTDWGSALLLLAIGGPVLLLLLREGQQLNLLLLGESQARLLGVVTSRLRRRLVLLVALGVGTVVSLGGLIGFIGLVVPHLVRLLCGPDNRALLPLSALLGALLLTLADILARLLVSPAELPIGIVTALIGGPFFLLMILYRQRGRV
ncbi:iron ABC transporter [Marinobacterium aestuarii]|uniref:Iron ABC transporter n=1 Tax=Marinobacterium aestuarii TaxID=1821621 RepID=A0A1A9F4U3_9GAMM|nr:iron chelate uptake ABC transporter family permease subunit [Marinobacterium aestuarii]ANG64908.1 iron ABC transporter [Marinobacterium aestuarii]